MSIDITFVTDLQFELIHSSIQKGKGLIWGQKMSTVWLISNQYV